MRKPILYSLIFMLCELALCGQTWGSSLSPTTVTVQKAVHFMTPDGSNVVIEPGTYIIEVAEEWLRFISGERRDALLLQATPIQHDETLELAKAVSESGEDDEYRIALLLPEGTGLEAIGSVSGIRSRAVKRPLTSQTKTQQQTSRIPTQSAKGPVVQQPTTPSQAPGQSNDPLAQRVQVLEQQVSSLTSLVNTLQGQLNLMSSAIQVDNAGRVTIGQASTVTIQGSMVNINASAVRAQAATSKFSGLVQADTVITNSVVSSSYTPGAGNIW
ncbi:MAG: hypothetical protein WD425_21295 [Nitrospirales bacterium]